MEQYSTSVGPGGDFNPTVSIFKGSTNTTPTGACTLAQVLERIRGETERPFVEQLRATLHTEGKKAYDAAKKRSWAFTPGGVFTQRANRKLTQPSGLLNYDLDHLADLPAAKARLETFPSLAYLFVSPSGTGLKLGCWASQVTDHATYRHAWLTVLAALQAIFPDLGVTNDKHCKDIARLCYLSWDPDAYRNPAPVCFPVPAPSPPPPVKVSPIRRSAQPTRSGSDEQPRVEEALQAIPADEYDTWLRVGMALHSSGETWGRAVWDTWSQRSAKYDPTTQEEKWDSFTPEAGVTLSTIFFLAGQHGYERRNGQAPDPEQPLPYSDYTNARAFVRDHGQDLRYCLAMARVAGVDRNPLAP